MRPGPRNSITDIAGLCVGNAVDTSAKTGVTVLRPDEPMVASVHVMGGAPGTRDTDLLAPDKTVDAVHALVLSGGSAFGLDAAGGVMEVLAAENIGFEVGSAIVPIVPTAILFDLLNGGVKSHHPHRELAQQACQTAHTDFDIGSAGAGIGAIAGDLKGGLGTASLVLPNGITVAALVACNSLGNTTCSPSGHFWAAPHEVDGEFGGLGVNPNAIPPEETFRTKMDPPPQDGANTTIAIVATDADLSKAQCHRLAVASHDGFARAIYPAHTPFDGDLIFAGATGEKSLTDPIRDTLMIGHAASLCMARAIARGIFAARHEDGDLVDTWQNRFGSK